MEEHRIAVVNAGQVKNREEGHRKVIITGRQVSSFFGGNYFYLFVYEIYNDVRLVGTPPQSIGKFGSDSDNWEWPRHTVDFSVFRVYSGPDGKPAPFSRRECAAETKTPSCLYQSKILKRGFCDDPGLSRINRQVYDFLEIDEVLNIEHPNRIKIRGVKQDIWMNDMQSDPKINIQYSDKYFKSSNYWKYSIGQKAGLERLDVKNEKRRIGETIH
jgi:hypothetical protein